MINEGKHLKKMNEADLKLTSGWEYEIKYNFISSGLLSALSKDSVVAKSADRRNFHPSDIVRQKNPGINPGFLCRAGLA